MMKLTHFYLCKILSTISKCYIVSETMVPEQPFGNSVLLNVGVYMETNESVFTYHFDQASVC